MSTPSQRPPGSVPPPTPPPDAPPGAGAHRRPDGGFSPWNLLLVLPLLGTLIPMVYNRTDPALGGMPFFYWYQLVWIPISVTFTYLVYRQTKGDR